MLGRFIRKYLGWTNPELSYQYTVTRLGRDLFRVGVSGRTAKVSAEVGDRQNGKYEIALYPSTVCQWEDGSAVSVEDRELILKTLEQFLVANNYVPRRA